MTEETNEKLLITLIELNNNIKKIADLLLSINSKFNSKYFKVENSLIKDKVSKWLNHTKDLLVLLLSYPLM